MAVRVTNICQSPSHTHGMCTKIVVSSGCLLVIQHIHNVFQLQSTRCHGTVHCTVSLLTSNSHRVS